MLVLTFQVGDEAMAVDIRRVREVVPRVALRSLAGAPAWLAGVFVYRGTVIPAIDLHRLAGGGECPPHLSSRIVLVPHGDRLLGLLATQVADIRGIDGEPPPLPDDGRAGFGPVVADGTGVLRLIDPERLLPKDDLERVLARLGGGLP